MNILNTVWKNVSRTPVVVGLAIAGGIVLIYLPAISLYLWGDDFPLLNDAYPVWHTPQLLLQQLFVFFRPLTRLFYFLSYVLFRYNIFAYKIITVALHILNTLLLYIYLFRLTRKVPLAALTAVLFGTSSFYSEVPLWMAVLPDSQVTAFMLGTFILFSKEPPLTTRKDRMLFVLLLLGAFASKENWMMLPFLLFAFLVLCKKYSLKRTLVATFPAFILLCFYIGIFFVLPVFQRAESALSYSHPIQLQTFRAAGLKFCYLLYKYAGFGDYFYGEFWQIALLGIICIAIVAIAIALSNHMILWGMAWMVLTMVPTMHIYYAASRYNYLPLIGFWIMIVALFDALVHALRQRFIIRQRFVLIFFTPCIISVILYHGIMTQWEIHDYALYANLHRMLVDRYTEVQALVPMDRPILLMDQGTRNAVVEFDRGIRGHLKMQYSKPGGLWQIIYFDHLANYVGDPFTYMVEPINKEEDIEALLKTPFTVLVFTDNGFEMIHQHDNALRRYYETHQQLPDNIQAYTVRTL